MWTTSSSLADAGRRAMPARPTLLLALVAVLASCTGENTPGVASVTPPDAPRTATAPPSEAIVRTLAKEDEAPRPELREVTIRRFGTDDEPLSALAGSAYLAAATEPLVLEARLTPFPLPVGTSSPILVLNGEALHETTIHPGEANTLVALLPDRSRLRDDNRVSVRWIGREETRSTKGVVLPQAEIEAALRE